MHNLPDLSTGTEVSIELEVFYTDGSTGKKTLLIDPDTALNWYNISASFVAEKDFQLIDLYLKNNYNTTSVYFDDIWLAVESYGTHYTIDNEGNITAVTGLNGKTSGATYNSLGLPRTQTDALGNTTTYTYGQGNTAIQSEINNKLLTETTPMGQRTEYSYDEYGNVSGITYVGSGIDYSGNRINGGTAVYGNYGLTLSTQTDAFGNTTGYIPNSQTFFMEEIDTPNGAATVSYNFRPQMQDETDAPNNQDGPLWKTEVYGEGNRTTPISTVRYGYTEGQLDSIEREQFYYYMPVRPSSAWGTVTSGDESGEKVMETEVTLRSDANWHPLSKTYYDKRGLPLQVQYGNYSSDSTNALEKTALYNTHYDQLGRLSLIRRGNNTTHIDTDYTYNREGALFRSKETNTLLGKTTVESFLYDLAGQVISRTVKRGDQVAEFNYTYDALGRVSSAIIASAYYGYNANPTFVYNANGQLTQQAINEQKLRYSYDELGRLMTSYLDISNNSNSIYSTYTYESLNSSVAQATDRVSSFYTFYTNQGNFYPDFARCYTYDEMGNIARIGSYDTGPGYEDATTDFEILYTYDDLGQLKSATKKTIAGTQLYQESFSYVNEYGEGYQGNIAVANKNGVVYNYNYQVGWNDLLDTITDADGNIIKAYTYDTIGNMLSDGTDTYEWVFGRMLHKIKTGETTKAEYAYNNSGIRQQKIVGNIKTEYLLDGSTILAEKRTNLTTNESTTLRYYYGQEGLALIEHNGSYYWPVTNLQGDILELVQINADGSGTRICQYEYSAFGELLSVKDNDGYDITDANHIAHLNPFRYRGYYYDTETGFYYLQSRYYDPSIGRFISADSYVTTLQGPLSYNMFAYCGNNPVNRADDGGKFWHIVIGAAIGAVSSAIITGITSYLKKGQINWASVGISAAAGALNGGLAATGVGAVGMAIGNAAIAVAEDATTQVVQNKGFNDFDVGSVLMSGVSSGITGALGGSNGSKHLTNLGNQTIKRTYKETIHKGIKAGFKEAKKAFAYYGKNTARYYDVVRTEATKDFVFSICKIFILDENAIYHR